MIDLISIILLALLGATLALACLWAPGKRDKPPAFDDDDLQAKPVPTDPRQRLANNAAAILECDPPPVRPDPSYDPVCKPAKLVPWTPEEYVRQGFTPCPAIQEAEKRLADLPDIVAVINPNPTPQEALQAANRNRQTVARLRIDECANLLRNGASLYAVANSHGYSTDSMRKALNRYGYKSNGQPKEAPHDPA